MSQLRTLQKRLSAAVNLVASLIASQGDSFHHSFLSASLDAARAAGIVVTNSIDSLLAVRMVTSLAEAMEWTQLANKLAGGLVHNVGDKANEIRSKAIVHAVEFILRPAVGAPSDTPEHRLQVGLARIEDILKMISTLRDAQELWSMDCLSELCVELGHLETIASFAKNSLSGVTKPGLPRESDVQQVETARTVLLSKNSKLLKPMSCLNGGVWLMEVAQDVAAEFHAQMAILAGLDKACFG